MSGGIGPTAGTDISLPNELSSPSPHQLPHHSEHRRFLSFRQLNSLALIVILSTTGMVAPTDLAFSLFSFAYLYFLSSTSFPPTNSSPPPVFASQNLLLSLLVGLGFALGLILPIGYILDGILAGDKEGIKAAVPHVFLLASQVFLEGVTFSRHFSLPMRAFVPIFYNTKRLFALVDWVQQEVNKVEGEHGSHRRLVAGRALAVANLAFWSFNLFGFLLPVYLPRAVKRYYGGASGNECVSGKDSTVKDFSAKVK